MPKHAKSDGSGQEESVEQFQPIEVTPDSVGGDDRGFITPDQKKTRRMKRVLIIVAILLVVLIGVLGYLAFLFVTTTQDIAVQQSNQQSSQSESAINEGKTTDADSSRAKKTTVPDLISLIGASEQDALERLADYGASSTSTNEVNEEGNPVKSRVTLALTAEPGDARSGTPTVHLGLNEEGLIYQVGYSAATASLGYGSISYMDAVTNEYVIENTLREGGLEVQDGSAQLPVDKTEYSTYASDGVTLVKENNTFEGQVAQNEKTYTWSAVLMYDYTLANQSGILADTIRQVYIYINEG